MKNKEFIKRTKQIFALLFITAIFSLNIYGKPIDENTAKRVGLTFLKATPSAKSVNGIDDLVLVYSVDASIQSKILKNYEQINYFYIFNTSENGFVIVAGDDNVNPIWGYSDEGIFDPNNIPPNMQKWLEGYKDQIRYVIEENIPATEQIRTEWDNYLKGISSNMRSTSAVGALVKTKWGQGAPYNAQCPGTGTNKAITGCVATAMSQIMKYWNYPASGTGFHSYNHQKYGTLSANFGSTTYQWSSMPVPSTTSSNSAVATLMYHAGVSVDMDYGPEGSAAVSIGAGNSAENAFKTYFGYRNTLQGISRDNYTQTEWINLLKTELDASRPVYFAGTGADGGHAFVCDGYDNNNFFHFNWGWDGSADGNFSINGLNPGGGSFNTNQRAIIGIQPPASSSTQSVDLRLYSDITMTSTSVRFYDPISITVRIVNYGTSTFQGSMGAAVFNSEGVFIDFLSTSTQTLESNYNVEKTFSNTGGAPFIPGDYILAVFYRPSSGGDWRIIADGNYTNYKTFKIVYSAAIETYSKFTIGGNGILRQSQSATVNVDVLNSTTSTFNGRFRLNLATLDGEWAQNIGIYTTTTGLQPNYHYTNGLNFTGTITVAPGTYLMEICYQRSGETPWYYAGSSKFQNPIFVIVEANPLKADPFEQNNTVSTASVLPVNFSNNNANVRTTGSNFHDETDIDFYRINLPTGYNYTVKPRLHDSYNSGNGLTYTVDAVFSYSVNSTNSWSETYDDVMPGNISITNGGTIYFRVSPYYLKTTGTYLLDVQITRSQNTDLENIEFDDQISIYPNPANDFVKIDFQNTSENISKIILYDIQGRQIIIENYTDSAKAIQLPLHSISSGIYFMQIHSTKGIVTKKLIVEK